MLGKHWKKDMQKVGKKIRVSSVLFSLECIEYITIYLYICFFSLSGSPSPQ